MAAFLEGAEVRHLTQPYEKIGVNSTFKTAINGFDKEAVLFYIDNLRKDTAQQQRTFTAEIDRLYTRNGDLTRNLANCEKEIELLKQQISAEREKQTVLTEESDILHKLVEKLQSKLAELQEQLDAQKALSERLNQSLYLAGKQAEEYRQAAAAATQQAQSNNANYSDASRKASELYNQVNYLNSQAEARERAFAERINRYEQTINYFKANYDNLSSENTRLKRLNPDQLFYQNQELNTAVRQLQSQVYKLKSELGSQTDYVNRLINQLNDARNRQAAAQPAYINYGAQQRPVQPYPAQQPCAPRQGQAQTFGYYYGK